MRARLANLNHCAVPFSSCAPINHILPGGLESTELEKNLKDCLHETHYQRDHAEELDDDLEKRAWKVINRSDFCGDEIGGKLLHRYNVYCNFYIFHEPMSSATIR